MISIYKSDIADLLLPDEKLPCECRIEPKDEYNFCIPAATNLLFKLNNLNSEEIRLLMKKAFNTGVDKRTMRSTEVNETSSRSHLLFSITVTHYKEGIQKTSKFMFVDLAGSERLA